MRRHNNRLQIELLESRVMLSTVDMPSNLLAETITENAIQSNDAHIAVELLPYQGVLTITGSGHGNVSIDLSKLDASVIYLQVSSFDSVTLVGEGSLHDLVVGNVARLDAGHVSLDRLFGFGVESISIDLAPAMVMLTGSNGTLGTKTLLEAGHFTENGYVFSYLENLGLATSSSVQDLNVVSFNGQQSVLLNFKTGHSLGISGFDSPSQINVINGDFGRYFLASPTERTSLEQSVLVARQSAVTSPISQSSLLSNPTVQEALSSMVGAGFNSASSRSRTLIENDLARPAISPDLSAEALVRASASDSGAHTKVPQVLFEGQIAAPPSQPMTLSIRTTPHPTSQGGAVFGLSSAADTIADAHHAAGRFGDSASAAVLAALARLSEPFTQVVSDLRDQLTTFGGIVTARVTDHLKADHQSPLLVDTSITRSANKSEVLVVTV